MIGSSLRPARLSRRLALQLALMTAVVVGATLGSGIYLIEQQRGRMAQREMGRAREVVRGASARRAASVDVAVEALVRRIEGDPSVLRQLIGRDGIRRDLAATLASGTDFQVLELAGDDGMILASLHWPERVGLASPYVPDRRLRSRLDTPLGERFGWFHQREMRIGQQTVSLIAGRFLETGWLDEAAALADVGWWVPADRANVLSSSTASITEFPGIGQVERAVAERRLQIERWRLEAIPFADSHGSLGSVVLALRDRDDRTAWRRLRGAWIGLTIVAALASALVGLVIGRRAARPVDQLVRAVDAIAAGREDYSFPGIPQDEFDELVASFSRLQRSLDQQRRRSAAAERVAVWQEVARHVAHEVKNPLAPIRLTVQNLQRARREHPGAFTKLFEEGAQTILEEVDQLSRLVGEFSEFARLPVPQPSPEPLEPLLDEVLELYAADPALKIVRRSSGDLPPVNIDRDQISRVFKNIVGNAVEAMAAAETRELQVESVHDGGYAEIRFSDSGPGFAGEADRRVFEPYFTTKSQGTGLGMAISYRMVAEHGGEIVAENRARGGACVTVRLPLKP